MCICDVLIGSDILKAQDTCIQTLDKVPLRTLRHSPTDCKDTVDIKYDFNQKKNPHPSSKRNEHKA